MPIVHLIVSIALTLGTPQECDTWQECRDQAAAAAARQELEGFHDLAGRAVQKGPKNDPALMLLLARAQSLSGRPGDALVMLERLAAMGVPNDAATNDDFRRVRSLARWPELARRLEASPGTAVPAPVAPGPAPAIVNRTSAAALPPPRLTAEPTEAVRFATPGLSPDALAYDRVSRRFLVADRHARKLVVVDEFSRNVATLAGAQAAFGDIEAIEIDSRLGDLWVVSTEPAAAGGTSTLHKLQLISGRVLSTYSVAPPMAPARFADVAIANGSTVLVLDTDGGRVFRVRNGSLDLAGEVGPGATGIAPTGNGALYVASPEGLARLDLASRTTSAVNAAEGVDVSRLSRIRHHGASLVGVQRSGSGTRLVRLTLDRAGRTVTEAQVIDTVDDSAGAFALSGDALYYYASRGAGEAVLKKLSLAEPGEKRP
jgi:hypothetical protein